MNWAAGWKLEFGVGFKLKPDEEGRRLEGRVLVQLKAYGWILCKGTEETERWWR